MLTQEENVSYNEIVPSNLESDLYNIEINSTFDLYFNISLTDNEIINIIDSANLPYMDASDMGIPGLLAYSFFNFKNTDNIISTILFFKVGDVYALTLQGDDSSLRFLWCSADFDVPNIGFISKGWNSTFINDTSLYSPVLSSLTFVEWSILDGRSYINFVNDLMSDKPFFIEENISYTNTFNFVVKEVIDNETYYMSFFDVSMFNTDNTFKKFQLPFLRNGFEKVFVLLQFENSFTSSFVITILTWFVQFMLLHVIVDTLTFIFKLYHKLMEKVV